MATFTPGPWFVTGEPGYESQNDRWHDGRTVGSVPEGTRVCDVAFQRTDDKAKADARLIAAAPEMVEALTEIANTLQTSDMDLRCVKAVRVARAALSKALGKEG